MDELRDTSLLTTGSEAQLITSTVRTELP